MRTVCGWCPLPLPNDDQDAWRLHHLVEHGREDGYSVRHYYDDDPLEELFKRV